MKPTTIGRILLSARADSSEKHRDCLNVMSLDSLQGLADCGATGFQQIEEEALEEVMARVEVDVELQEVPEGSYSKICHCW